MHTSKTIMTMALMFIAALLLVSCAKKAPLTEDQKAFAGKWAAGDGSYVVIYYDGGGDLKSSNTKITGGRTTFSGDSITIGLGPLKKVMKITEKPKLAGGNWVLVLDGISYTKE
jgi:hypothetical protein